MNTFKRPSIFNIPMHKFWHWKHWMQAPVYQAVLSNVRLTRFDPWKVIDFTALQTRDAI
jgi:hypothetical protein